MKVKTITAGMLGNNIYIGSAENGECFIVDPGAGSEKIVEYIKSENLTPKAILLTHGHFDHIAKVAKVNEEFNLPVYIGKGDSEMLDDPTIIRSGIMVHPIKDYITVEDGEILNIGGMEIKCIATPGHSKGGICYLSEGEMFVGDTIFRGNIGRCDLYGGDYHTILKSLAKVADIDARVYCGHGECTTMAQERMHNPYFPKNR